MGRPREFENVTNYPPPKNSVPVLFYSANWDRTTIHIASQLCVGANGAGAPPSDVRRPKADEQWTIPAHGPIGHPTRLPFEAEFLRISGTRFYVGLKRLLFNSYCEIHNARSSSPGQRAVGKKRCKAKTNKTTKTDQTTETSIYLYR
jgi:hypothetical protein